MNCKSACPASSWSKSTRRSRCRGTCMLCRFDWPALPTLPRCAHAGAGAGSTAACTGVDSVDNVGRCGSARVRSAPDASAAVVSGDAVHVTGATRFPPMPPSFSPPPSCPFTPPPEDTVSALVRLKPFNTHASSNGYLLSFSSWGCSM